MSFDVRFWSVRKNAKRRRPYEFRWIVAGQEHSRSFLTKAVRGHGKVSSYGQ